MTDITHDDDGLVDTTAATLACSEDQAVSSDLGSDPGYNFSSDVYILSRPRSPQAESISELRAQLNSQHIRDGRRSVAICAATSGVGSTFLSVNLAVAMALAGKRTLLIDANLRSPGVHKYITPPGPAHGLINHLLDDPDSDGIVVHSDIIPNLSVIYAGTGEGVPQELVAGRRFSEVINKGMRSHEFTVVDTPPANEFSDYLGISVIAGYALLVARKDLTRVADLKTVAGMLLADRVRLVGAFMNVF
ncbi:CpsD/CapB family tyrosine-protein kinase [Novosphingobium aerophilum]|uniref:CpsD/CapB family tyrosine-protein kinase n=1 Tax=Novosphingobium aerophilum TaxID=2839843 RepID=A0A7X1KDR9_9SPHN|nr:CpsD/CapB family tyrosine-protein kinase [Novosphingobium aerophilum]MBC2653645.1 CpsD/CapB family tyrosine-protein kinase [Novosphingobium aerophilum]